MFGGSLRPRRLPLEINEAPSVENPCQAIATVAGIFLSLIMAVFVVVRPVFLFPSIPAAIIITLVCTPIIWGLTAWLIHSRNTPPA